MEPFASSDRPLPPPRVAAVHDLSCVGRCALTVIIPTLSVMGYQVIPFPTALLSSHTGGFDRLYFRDLTPDMSPIAAHFERLGTSFRAIYTGFLGSAEQIRTVEHFLDTFGGVPDESGKPPLILIDPVMGDEGKLYSTYTEELAHGIGKLSRCADLLTPNLTEACLLAGIPYRETAGESEEIAKEIAVDLIDRLRRTVKGKIVVTGILTREGKILNACEEGEGTVFFVAGHKLQNCYPGTGDVFASVLLGRVLAGKGFREAVADTTSFIERLIAKTSELGTELRYGVALEPYLKEL